MKIAVVGCAHGDIENIYNTIEYAEKENNINVDLVLCCGDFQATRNLNDLQCLAAPPKYRSLCQFYKYYSGEKLAPKLTIFVGGNHEASNYLQELPYGGWVAQNIYYLGYAGVVNFGGLRIAGISGIYKGEDYAKGRFEKPPYNESSLRSCYHIRNLDIFRLKQLSSPIDIILSHDWPQGIAYHGNTQQLLKRKPYLREDIENNVLGSKPATEILEHLKPDYWFAAHLHVKFPALYKHSTESASETKSTKFLALDKCLPRRRFLQILNIPQSIESEKQLKYDLEWLTILHLTNHILSVKKFNSYMPGPGSSHRWDFRPTKEEMDFVLNKFANNLVIPNNFVSTAPAHRLDLNYDSELGKIFKNPQTVDFCQKLSVDDPVVLLSSENDFNKSASSLNMSTFESSTFIRATDSELDNSTDSNISKSFIKERMRTPLKLPTPVRQLEENSDEFQTSTPTNKQVPEINDMTTTKENMVNDQMEPVLTENTADENVPVPQKFRRRNIALYSSTDE